MKNLFDLGWNWKTVSKLSYTSEAIVSNAFPCTSKIREHRCQMFEKEKLRQQNLIARIEKIEVKYIDSFNNKTSLIMNKYLSTPYNCAQHISELLLIKSALAEVNGKLWDMHRPLEEDCELRFLHFYSAEPYQVNRAFWRTGSFLIGSIIENAFCEKYQVQLHSFPSPNVRSGSFIYDASLALDSWKPTETELRMLSAQMVKVASQELPIQRLDVSQSIAEDIFQYNSFKLSQIPKIANETSSITLYRVGDFVDISRGPMIGNSKFFGRCYLAAVHIISSKVGSLYRFQGVALPKEMLLNHFAWKLIVDRAKQLNSAQNPDAIVSTPI